MKKDNNHILEQSEINKMKIVEKAYFYFILINTLNLFLSKSRTTYTKDEEFTLLYSTFLLLIGLMSVLFITRLFVTKLKLKMQIYTILGTVYIIQMHHLFLDKAFVTLGSMAITLLIIPSMMNRLKYLIYFSIIPITINIYYIINPPDHAIQIGQAFYFRLITTFVISFYLLYQSVKQNKWYENQLEERVRLTESQNEELSALNEEYIATEEELFHKYDELSDLNIELSATSKKLSTILNVTHEAFIEINTQNLEIKFNRMTKKLLHFSEEDEVDLNTIVNQFSESEIEKLRNSFYDIKNDIVIQNETEVAYIYDMSKSYYILVMTKFVENDIEYVLVAGKDITLEKEEEQSLYKAAYVDKLTGLMTKQALYKQVDMRLEQNDNKFAMYILDLKGMKNINAMFGFKIGDEVIKSVGLSLKRIFEEGSLLARTGGDEFTIIIDSTINPRVLNDLISEKLDRFIDYDMNFRINYKLGVAYMRDAKNSMELYENAEMAMYRAKENIIDDVTIYKKEYRNEAEKSIKLSQELENALFNKELFLNFQPEVSSETGKIVGYEALVRWKSSKLGFVSPMDFIQVAEQTGYIIVLGRFIIEESCRFAKKAILKNPDLIVSINISGVQLKKYDFESELLKTIDYYEVPRRNIGIEITETAIISNMERSQKVLNNIKKLGITIFLDDFGTGYSSLSYLSTLPIDVLKIDKSFIDEIETDIKQKNMVKQIIILAKSMGLRVVAEGVEVEEQFEILRRYQCEIIQGYYFYKPLNQEDALELL